jgi:CheY-like chemotaxis protein
MESTSAATSSKKRILIVDDSEDLRDFSRMILEASGYEVETAASGEEAFEKTRELRPDLILLDVVMPGMDGFELLTRLRSDLAPPVPPAILCSGFDITEEEALRRGALMFVRKPIAPDDLQSYVAEGLLGHRIDDSALALARAHATAARQRAFDAAIAVARRIRADAEPAMNQFERMLAGQLGFLRAYFGVGAAMLAVLRDDGLATWQSDGDVPTLHPSELEKQLPQLSEIIETGSSLLLADIAHHPSFRTRADGLDGVRFIAGVPLHAPEGASIGALCLLDKHPRLIPAEDLLLLEHIGRRGSILIRLLTEGRPYSELPGRLGPGMALQDTFEMMVTLEARLLRRNGGSLVVAVFDVDDPPQVGDAIMHARCRERLASGQLGPRRVAVVKRDPADGARAQLDELLRDLGTAVRLGTVGAVDLAGEALPLFPGGELIHLAELTLEQAREDGSGVESLVMRRETSH